MAVDPNGGTIPDGVAGRARAAEPVERIGHFEVRKKLGEGGMGVVYEAYDAQLDRPVAIKLVRVDQGGPQAHARLLREAQAMAKVSHPNVVPIYETGTHGEQVFVAMELVPGETLAAWRRRQPRTWEQSLAMYCAAGRGLAAAHERGIIHRDFKPDNVLVGLDERPRVLDFGLARSVAAAGDDIPTDSGQNVLRIDLTVAGSMMGTPHYMSPEHFRGLGIGPASDQFGFAVAVYRALFDAAPFAGDSLAELADSVCGGKLRPPPSATDVPAPVVAAIVRALSTDPNARFPSMAALLDVLEAPLRVDPQLDVSRGRRGRSLAAAALSVGALGSLAATSALTNLDESPAGLLMQSTFVTLMLCAIGFVFRRRLLVNEHNRRVGQVILMTGVAFMVHRGASLAAGTPVLDTLLGDATLLGLVTVISGIVFERWMLAGGPLALLYLVVAILVPEYAAREFGGLVLVYAVAASYKWS